MHRDVLIGSRWWQAPYNACPQSREEVVVVVFVGSVCQSAPLLREKRKRRDWKEIYSKPYLTLLLWLSFYFIHTLQTVDRQRENNTQPLCSVLHSISALSCHSCALVVSRYCLFSSLPFSFTITEHCQWEGSKLLPPWRDGGDTAWPPMRKHRAFLTCPVALIRDLLITCRRGPISRNYSTAGNLLQTYKHILDCNMWALISQKLKIAIVE